MPISLTTTPVARETPSDTISSNTPSTVDEHTKKQISTSKKPNQNLSERLPPLVFGTATLNYQFNVDPYALHPNNLVASALAAGVRAFDTSPYYGPAEEILGTALHSSEVKSHSSLEALKREDYCILTKAGRIAGDVFDYSPSWIRHSVKRSLRRLKTTYLDVVYLHDVEFVSPEEVLSAIRTLREIRDTNNSVHHVGICGYPIHILTSLAEMILHETGEPLDIVQSYANFTLQNCQLQSQGLQRLIDAGVDVIPNASPLGMGLLRSQGVPVGAMGNWHPAPDTLRNACLSAAKYTQEKHKERLETVAVRFAMENWVQVGSKVGSKGPVPTEAINTLKNHSSKPNNDTQRPKLGVNVMGVSKLCELEETMRVYNSIVIGTAHPSTTSSSESDPEIPTPHQLSHRRKHQIQTIANELRTGILADWLDYAWSSPDPGFANQRTTFGASIIEIQEEEELRVREAETNTYTDTETENRVLLAAVQHLKHLEKSVTGDHGDEKAAGIEIEVDERTGELTPPPGQG